MLCTSKRRVLMSLWAPSNLCLLSVWSELHDRRRPASRYRWVHPFAPVNTEHPRRDGVRATITMKGLAVPATPERLVKRPSKPNADIKEDLAREAKARDRGQTRIDISGLRDWGGLCVGFVEFHTNGPQGGDAGYGGFVRVAFTNTAST